jgi:hypothetical protein
LLLVQVGVVAELKGAQLVEAEMAVTQAVTLVNLHLVRVAVAEALLVEVLVVAEATAEVTLEALSKVEQRVLVEAVMVAEELTAAAVEASVTEAAAVVVLGTTAAVEAELKLHVLAEAVEDPLGSLVLEPFNLLQLVE